MADQAGGVVRSQGAAPSFTDYDLISDLIGLPADKVAETLANYDLRSLGSMTERELLGTGLTPARARRLHSAFRLARRFGDGRPLRRGLAFSSPRQIFDAYSSRFRDEKREHFIVVLLDARHRILREEVVSIGSLSSSIVHPREVFRPAIRAAAGCIVLVHNHPSGDPRPSEEDVAVTRRLVSASDLIGIRVLDHVVLGDGHYTSFKEEGLL